ncbi:IS200/IS605 family transposase [Chloroflexota bacterium]
MKKRLLGHTVYKTQYHISWNTKYRHDILEGDVRIYLGLLLFKVLETLPGCELVEYSIQPDHVHMLVIIPPKYSVSRVVGRIKGKTASKIRAKFPELQESYWKNNTLWSTGFYVSSVGWSEKKTLEYIQKQ